MTSAGQYAATRQAEDLETQNDDNIQGLSAKVKLLKDVSLINILAPLLTVSTLLIVHGHTDYAQHWE